MGYVIFAIVVAVLAFALQPKPPESTPSSLREGDIPTAEEGKAIPKVFGKRIIQSPNIVWYGDLGYNKVKKSGSK